MNRSDYGELYKIIELEFFQNKLFLKNHKQELIDKESREILSLRKISESNFIFNIPFPVLGPIDFWVF